MSKAEESCDAAIVLVTYNQEKTVRQALSSCLNQSKSANKIIICDDCSTDRTYQFILDELQNYDGSASVILNRQAINIGLVANLNSGIVLASERYIMIQAGDDVAHYERLERSVRYLSENKDLAAVSFRDVWVDESGFEVGRRAPFSNKFSVDQIFKTLRSPISGASRTYRRDVFDYFGLLDGSLYSEDTPLLWRSVLLGVVEQIDFPGLRYRVSDTGLASPKNFKAEALDKIQAQLEEDLGKFLRQEKVQGAAEKRLARALRRGHDQQRVKKVIGRLRSHPWDLLSIIKLSRDTEGWRPIVSLILYYASKARIRSGK